MGLLELLLDQQHLHSLRAILAPSQGIHKAGLANTIAPNQPIFPAIDELQSRVFEQVATSDHEAEFV
jgi:hypothetical protein